MDNTEHHAECYWTLKEIKKSKKWYDFMGLKNCPNCGAIVEVTEDEEA